MITPAEKNPNIKANEPAPSPVGFKNVPSVESPVNLELVGAIPSWVNGTMYRTGNNKKKKRIQNFIFIVSDV